LAIPLRGVTLLSVFAILLQAALVGWHHHPIPLGSRGAPGVLTLGPPASHSTPALKDDDCQICFALSHHSAAPGDFYAAPMPPPAPQRLAAAQTVWALPSSSSFVRAPLLAFEVRFIHLTEPRGIAAGRNSREEFNDEPGTHGDAARLHDSSVRADCIFRR
jgi:hypothetical protein